MALTILCANGKMSVLRCVVARLSCASFQKTHKQNICISRGSMCSSGS